MSVAALFRGKWGHKPQETQQKQPAAVVPPSHEEEDDEDDSQVGFSRESNRRNSRFYRSMRKKRLASSQQSESKTPGLCYTFKLALKQFSLCTCSTKSIVNINFPREDYKTAAWLGIQFCFGAIQYIAQFCCYIES